MRHSLSYIMIHTHTHTPYTPTHTPIYINMHMGTHTDTNTHACTHTTFPSLPRMHTLSAPAVAWYLPAAPSVQEVQLVCAVKPENLPASQLKQTVAPAIYVHTLSHTTLCKFLHLHISRWCMYVCIDWGACRKWRSLSCENGCALRIECVCKKLIITMMGRTKLN